MKVQAASGRRLLRPFGSQDTAVLRCFTTPCRRFSLTWLGIATRGFSEPALIGRAVREGPAPDIGAACLTGKDGRSERASGRFLRPSIVHLIVGVQVGETHLVDTGQGEDFVSLDAQGFLVPVRQDDADQVRTANTMEELR